MTSRFQALLRFMAIGVLLGGAPAAKTAAAPEPPAAVSGAERESLDLNGDWQIASVDDPAYPPRAAEWRTAAVPATEYGNAIQGSRWIWYRRQVNIPESFRGKTVALLLSGARFNASVWCDGRFIASRLEGFTPWRVDLTGRVAPGGTALIEVRCQDWSAVFKDNYRLPPGADADGVTLRGVPKGKLIAPIGGHFYFFGIWDDVTLEARPPVRSDDVAISTSVRERTLTVTGAAVNGRPGLWLEAMVTDAAGKPVLALPGVTPGRDNRFSLKAPFPAPRFWSPEDPYRYTLTLTLSDRNGGIVLDVHTERFGFRELWAEGPDLFLNGVKRRLLASSGWPLARYQTPAEIKQAIADIRSSNAIAFRLHTQPWQRRWLEEADAAGLLIVEEGALWCDGGGGYAYDDDRFWENVREHLAGMIRRDRNHPSLVMWSIENEILHCGAMAHCGGCAEARLAETGRFVKALDPTHLITYEADHDPGGAADVIGLHYPRELPDNTDYPNTADWLGTTVTTGTAGGTAGSWNKDFFWDRKKPLYIGEYLWVFQQDYSAGSVFFGDEAYLDKEVYKNKAKALAWEIQTAAYRRAGVSGLCPWTIVQDGGRANRSNPLYLAQKNAYEPIAVFAREYDTRFWAGEKIVRTFDVFNDSAAPQRLELRVTLKGWTPGYRETFTLEPAGHKVVAVTVPLPRTPAPDGLAFEAALYAGGRKTHVHAARLSVFDKTKLAVPAGKKLIVYDPKGTWPEGTNTPGAGRLASLDELERLDPDKSLLVIAPNAFSGQKKPGPPVIGLALGDAVTFRRFLARGGRVLVLEQETYEGFLPELTLVSHSSTMTFPVTPAHPLLAGLSADAFKFWRGDHRVTLREIRRPVRGGARAALVSGGSDALDRAALLELDAGAGRLVLCQALAGAKYETEPAARRLIANALERLASERNRPTAALVVAAGRDAAAFRQALDAMGVVAAGTPGRQALDEADILLLHGGGNEIDALAPQLSGRKRPLTVYWHAPAESSFDRLKTVLGLEQASVIPAAGPIAIESADPLFANVLREDLTFLKPAERGKDWYREVEFDPSVIDRSFDFSLPGAARDRYEIETWALSGMYVRPTADGRAAGFYTNGIAAGEITTAQAGLYRLALVARGDLADGAGPVVLVKAGEKTAAVVNVPGAAFREISFLARLPRGKMKIELSFINDLYRDGADRNLYLDALLVDREPLSIRGLDLLTLPPAVMQTRPHPNLRVVIDTIRWDMNTANRVRGLRYASTLFANLGVPFAPPAADVVWIEPPLFETAGDIAVFSRTDASLNLGSNGRVNAAFTCARPGRFAILLRGRSTPLKGVYAKVTVRIDGKKTGEAEVKSEAPGEFSAGSVEIASGAHELSIEFTNDEWGGPGGEDRNFYLMGAGFAVAAP